LKKNHSKHLSQIDKFTKLMTLPVAQEAPIMLDEKSNKSQDEQAALAHMVKSLSEVHHRQATHPPG